MSQTEAWAYGFDDAFWRALARFRKTGGDVARATGNINEVLAGLGVEAIKQHRFPDPVHAARHQIVHQIIIAGDTVKDAAHHPRLFLGADALEAKIGVFLAGFIHRARAYLLCGAERTVLDAAWLVFLS